MSAEARKALTFEGVTVPFDWTNEAWAAAWLPRIRMAVEGAARDDKGLTELFDDLTKRSLAPDILDGWIMTRDHLRDIAELLDMMLTRSFVVLERLGYDPHKNVPPDREVAA
ncbi:hypothetical protein [Rhodoplanes sp. SY1]|uniref:hypothetical protein n=1 Tax=Rhodoplanes sp. SY1 TaxID=3166646 RepID=UPI0038B479BC